MRRSAARGRAHDRGAHAARSAAARSCCARTRWASACRSSLPRSGSRRRRGSPTGCAGSVPNLERVSGVLLVVLGVLLATDTYVHLTSYLARFVPPSRPVHGLWRPAGRGRRRRAGAAPLSRPGGARRPRAARGAATTRRARRCCGPCTQIVAPYAFATTTVTTVATASDCVVTSTNASDADRGEQHALHRERAEAGEQRRAALAGIERERVAAVGHRVRDPHRHHVADAEQHAEDRGREAERERQVRPTVRERRAHERPTPSRAAPSRACSRGSCR